MRHRHSGRQLNRNSSHRKAMFRNMANSLFEHELIRTTLPKAKELRRVAEPLITLAKKDSVANRRLAFDRTRSKTMVGKLFSELGPRYESRPGGYLRILKCGFRTGDQAPMAYVELVDRPQTDGFDIDDDFKLGIFLYEPGAYQFTALLRLTTAASITVASIHSFPIIVSKSFFTFFTILFNQNTIFKTLHFHGGFIRFNLCDHVSIRNWVTFCGSDLL